MLSSLVIQTTRELTLLGATHFFGCSLLLFIFSRLHEHLKVFIKNSGSHLNICKCLGRPFEVIHSPLAETGLHAPRDRGTSSRLSRLGIHGALKPAPLHSITILSRGLSLLLHISIKLYNLAFVMPVFVKIQEIWVHTSFLSVTYQDNIGKSIIE